MKKILQALDGASEKPVEGSNDMKKFLQVVTEGKNTKTNRLSQAENIVYMNTPKPTPVKLDETPSLFKTYLKLVEEEDINQIDNLKNKLDEHLQEVKSQQPPKPRNPVAKNANAAIGGGAAGAHKDKKKAQKQGEVKHKNKAMDMAESDDVKTDVVEEKKKTLKNTNPCWKGYKPVGTKKKGGRTVPNCVPVNEGDE